MHVRLSFSAANIIGRHQEKQTTIQDLTVNVMRLPHKATVASPLNAELKKLNRRMTMAKKMTVTVHSQDLGLFECKCDPLQIMIGDKVVWVAKTKSTKVVCECCGRHKKVDADGLCKRCRKHAPKPAVKKTVAKK